MRICHCFHHAGFNPDIIKAVLKADARDIQQSKQGSEDELLYFRCPITPFVVLGTQFSVYGFIMCWYRHQWVITMKKAAFAITIFCFCQSTIAQQASEAEIEEIIVIGELSRSAVRAQIIKVEDDIYSFYNARNTNKKLNIVCREVARIGTRIRQRVCEPVFWTEARARETQKFIKEWSGIAELENLSDKVILEYEEMNALYAELIQKYPAFAEALAILEDLKGRLAELNN